MIWEQKDIDRVKELVRSGKTSLAIADIFGTSKNAIVGLCQRQNIRLNGKRPKNLSKKYPIVNKTTPPVKMILCTEKMCKFVIGDPKSMLCCGDETTNGRIYCDAHNNLTHTISRPYIPKSNDYRR